MLRSASISGALAEILKAGRGQRGRFGMFPDSCHTVAAGDAFTATRESLVADLRRILAPYYVSRAREIATL